MLITTVSRRFCDIIQDMELKRLIKIFLKNNVLLAGSVIVGIILGAAIYYLPHKYSATGSFFVTRSTEPNTSEFFTYEGYYGQQTALSYTNTVIALLGSPDIRKTALSNLGIPVNEKTLRTFGRNIQTKKAGPQLITMTIRNENPEQALNLWNETSKVLILTAADINQNGDPNLHISTLLDKPVIKEPYRPLPIYITGGIFFSILAASIFISLKEYLS